MKKFIVIILLSVFTSGMCLAEQVVFNTSSKKYHKPSCRWAENCTKNCVKTEKSQAKVRGGVPCKTCGG